MPRVLRLLPAVLLPLSLSGCYGLHVAGGQLGILFGQEEIEDVLAEDSDLEADERAKLELVLDVRRYAIEEIGLEETGSYTCLYDTEGQPIAWNVSASKPDALAPYVWSFPFVGQLPYVGFFERDMAHEEADELKAAGLDTLVLPVPAYSTLGWFDDPLFSSLLKKDEGTIAEIVIHEMAHATVWIDGDAEFNENLATFIGVQGAKQYFRSRGGADHPTLKAIEVDAQDDAVFNEAMGALRSELMRIYESSGSRERKLELKKEAFARFRKRFKEETRPQLSDGGYDWVLEPDIPLNNALVLQFRRYHGKSGLFEALFEKNGRDLVATVRALKALEEEDDPRAALSAQVGVPVGK